MVELLKQGQYKPMDVIDQCISIFAASRGYMDDVPIAAVTKFEEGLLNLLKTQKAELRAKLETAKSFKGIEDEFKATVAAYKASFKA
jgi:F-type H+-transporting ATPase subunit alpha